MENLGTVKVTLVKSLIGTNPIQRKTARAMGLRKRGAERIHQMNGVTKGMIKKIEHLVQVVDATEK